jgi:hypothetical protein
MSYRMSDSAPLYALGILVAVPSVLVLLVVVAIKVL